MNRPSALAAPRRRAPASAKSEQRVRDILRQYLARRRRVAPAAQLPFTLVPLACGTAAWLDTAPDADLSAAGYPLRPLHLTPDGFLRVQVALDAVMVGR